MSEESTTPDVVGLVRQSWEAVSRGDFDALMSFLAPDAVYDLSDAGLETFEGEEAIRRFLEDWHRSWEDYRFEEEELLDLGHGVWLGVARESGRLVGGKGRVETRVAQVSIWANGKVEWLKAYPDIDEARAAAERLAEKRGKAISESLDLVRSIYAAWERGDYSSADWAHPEIEFVGIDGPEAGSWKGLASLAEGWSGFLSTWETYRTEADEYRELDDGRVLVLMRGLGRGKTTGMEVDHRGATVFRIRGGKVSGLVIYWERDRALADLGLTE